MRKFAELYPDIIIVQQVVAQLPWGHNNILLDNIDTVQERLWYARQAYEKGWSRDVPVHQKNMEAVTSFL